MRGFGDRCRSPCSFHGRSIISLCYYSRFPLKVCRCSISFPLPAAYPVCPSVVLERSPPFTRIHATKRKKCAPPSAGRRDRVFADRGAVSYAIVGTASAVRPQPPARQPGQDCALSPVALRYDDVTRARSLQSVWAMKILGDAVSFPKDFNERQTISTCWRWVTKPMPPCSTPYRAERVIPLLETRISTGTDWEVFALCPYDAVPRRGSACWSMRSVRAIPFREHRSPEGQGRRGRCVQRNIIIGLVSALRQPAHPP